MKNSCFLAALLCLFIVTSCDDFLEVNPKNELEINVALDDPDRLEASLGSCYDYISTIYGQWHTALHRLSATDLTMAGPGENGETGGYATYTHHADTWAPCGFWEQNYIALEQVNVILAKVDELTWKDEKQKNKVLGVASFFRAYMHFTLVQRFENIVLKDKPIEKVVIPTAADSKEDVYKLIISDLDRAIELLEWNTMNSEVSKGTAMYMRAKVALVLEDWQKAADLATSIIDDGPFRLLTSFGDNFDFSKLADNKEAILVASFCYDAQRNIQYNLHEFCTPQYDQVRGVKVSFEQGKHGRAMVYPTDYLLSLFEETDDRWNSSFKHIWYYDDEENLPVGKSLGDPVLPTDAGVGNPEMTIHACCTKYWEEGIENPNIDAWGGYESFPIFRLSEVYLIASEAFANLGNPENALKYINVVRNRANAKALSHVDTDVILEERARELCFEMHRWEDLKRTGKLVEQIRKYNPQAGPNVQEKHNLFPIPIRHIEYSNYRYPQNPGWD